MWNLLNVFFFLINIYIAMNIRGIYTKMNTYFCTLAMHSCAIATYQFESMLFYINVICTAHVVSPVIALVITSSFKVMYLNVVFIFFKFQNIVKYIARFFIKHPQSKVFSNFWAYIAYRILSIYIIFFFYQ